MLKRETIRKEMFPVKGVVKIIRNAEGSPADAGLEVLKYQFQQLILGFSKKMPFFCTNCNADFTLEVQAIIDDLVRSFLPSGELAEPIKDLECPDCGTMLSEEAELDDRDLKTILRCCGDWMRAISRAGKLNLPMKAYEDAMVGVLSKVEGKKKAKKYRGLIYWVPKDNAARKRTGTRVTAAPMSEAAEFAVSGRAVVEV